MCDLPNGGFIFTEKSLGDMTYVIASLGGRTISNKPWGGWFVPLDIGYTDDQRAQIDSLRPKGLYLPGSVDEFIAYAPPTVGISTFAHPLKHGENTGIAVLRVDADIHVILRPDFNEHFGHPHHMYPISFNLPFCPTYAVEEETMFQLAKQSTTQEEKVVELHTRLQNSIGVDALVM